MTKSNSQLEIKELKKNFLENLGAENKEKLRENLRNAFVGDAFRDNIDGIFGNYFVGSAAQNQNNFYESFLVWTKKKIDNSFKVRRKIATLNTIGLFGAFGLNFLFTPVAMAFGAAISLVSSIAEGVAKRNIANLGHLEAHLSHKIQGCTQRMIGKLTEANAGILTSDAILKLQQLKSPKNQSAKSASARFASYFSGPVVSAVNNLVSRFVGISAVAAGVIGAFIPFLPLFTFGLSKFAANLRHKAAVSEMKFVKQVANIIFDENNLVPDGKEKLSGIVKDFAQEFSQSDNHGRVKGEPKFHEVKAGSKDKKTNPKKAITLPTWAAAKVHKFVAKKLGQNVEDVAEFREVAFNGARVLVNPASESLGEFSKAAASRTDFDKPNSNPKLGSASGLKKNPEIFQAASGAFL
jgi:hypothetical protein